MKDPRIKALQDAGLPDTQLLQAWQELQAGDDSLLKDLARINDITLPQKVSSPVKQETAPDLNAMFDELMAEEAAKREMLKLKTEKQAHEVRKKSAGQPAPVQTAKPKTEKQARTAKAAAASAAKNTAQGLSDAIDGLGALFGGNGTLDSGPVLNEETCAKAKPLFVRAVAHLGQAGADIRELMRAIVKMVLDKFGAATAANMKPYVVRYVEEYNQNDNKEKNHDSTSENGAAPLNHAVDEGQRPAGSEHAARGAGTPGVGDGRADAGRIREPGRRSKRTNDAQQDLGYGTGDETVSAEQNGTVAGSGQRVSADFRPAIGGLTREGSWFDTAKRNVDLIELAIQIEKEGHDATPAEQELLSKYVGFGASAIRNVLFPVPGAYAKAQDPHRLIWPNLIPDARLAECLEALPVAWQKSVLQTSQHAHYTSEGIVRSICEAVQRMGFTGGKQTGRSPELI